MACIDIGIAAHAVAVGGVALFLAGWWLSGVYARWQDRRKPAPF
jgi:hypothetical protein